MVFTSIGINVHRSLLIWVELSWIELYQVSLSFSRIPPVSLILSCKHNLSLSLSFAYFRCMRRTFPFSPYSADLRAFTSSSSHLLHARFQSSCHEACIIRNHSIKSSSIFPYIVSGHFCLAPDINLFFTQCVRNVRNDINYVFYVSEKIARSRPHRHKSRTADE